MYLKQKFEIHQGHATFVLDKLDQIVHCVVTSPPYFQKRKYGDNKHEIGMNKTVEYYIDELCDVFDAVKLHPRGSIWVNIGDKRGDKGLQMIPERFALKMMDNGWQLVDYVVWAKIIDDEDGTTEGNCMIEPTTKRLNGNGWEPFYRFVKTKEAYCDLCAVRIPRQEKDKTDNRYMPSELMSVETSVEGRSLHNVWRVGMGQTKEKHYAVFPNQLCERPIAMTCPMRVDVKTKNPVERIVEMVEYDEGRSSKRVFGKYTTLEGEYDAKESKKVTGRIDSGKDYIPRKPLTKGWTEYEEYEAGVVLDPFCGSGTTGEVALRLGRSFIGIDLYENFKDISVQRCQKVFDEFAASKINPWELQK